MIKKLNIENFALIQKLDISFNDGFNVFTGETGSGKSIIIDAVSFVLGKRADKSFIRKGCKKAVIEAVFFAYSETSHIINKLLEDEGIDTNDNIYIFNRELFEDGRSTSKINDKFVTTKYLKQIASYLITIHGQNEFESILNKDSQLDILDDFSGLKSSDDYQNYKTLYITYKDIQRQISQMESTYDPIAINREIDLLQYQINEISDAKLSHEEIRDIDDKIKVMENAEEISKIINKSYETLYSSNDNVLKSLSVIHTSLIKYSNFDKKIKSWEDLMNDIYYRVEDLSISIRDSLENYNYDINEFHQLQQRYDDINKILGKYGKNYEDVLKYLESSVERLEYLKNIDNLKENLNRQLSQVIDEMSKISLNMSSKRKESSSRFESLILDQLHSLDMFNSQFRVEITSSQSFTETGMDKINFLVSFNKGEDIKPLIKVASGGEISRFMLALKKVNAAADKINTLIFDEIDTGISGNAAFVVGKKLKEISQSSQVICITHLPQIAAKANYQYVVEKTEADNTTLTNIKLLNNEQRILEVAKMLSGQDTSENSIRYAQELIDSR